MKSLSLFCRLVLFVIILSSLPVYSCSAADPVSVIVDVVCRREIEGISELERSKYFSICDQGEQFDRRCDSEATYQQLINDWKISFGRRLGLVAGYVKSQKNYVVEDARRPGYVDLKVLKAALEERGTQPPSRQMKRDFKNRLDVACHGHHNAYPDFMGKFSTPASTKNEDKPEFLPQNIDAAAELATTVLKHGFHAFSRPRYYEPVNEPHWSFIGDQHLADWHVQTRTAVQRDNPKVLVGGPCMPVAYFYSGEYKAFDGLKSFMEGTKGELDFYSFHVYDYFSERDGRFGGRITSGLPLESVLDLAANHFDNKFGKELKVVVSEHGGYGADDLVESIAKEKIPGSGFEWEMKKRSIADFHAMSSIIGNTMVFLDHPHTIQKAVPFILLNSIPWDYKYDAVLYTADGFSNRSKWVATKRGLFYDFFRDLAGHRLKAFCADPDIQTRAFADGSRVAVVLNNLSDKSEALSFRVAPAKEYRVRRLGRNEDATPFLSEESVTSLKGLRIEPRETMMVILDYGRTLPIKRSVKERICYGNRMAVAIEKPTNFSVSVPDAKQIDYAVLRVGVSRPSGSNQEIRIRFNGKRLKVPLEDCADRLDDGGKHGYASTKIVWIPSELVRERNRVSISFPDGKPGSVGAVVIRAGLKAS